MFFSLFIMLLGFTSFFFCQLLLLSGLLHSLEGFGILVNLSADSVVVL